MHISVASIFPTKILHPPFLKDLALQKVPPFLIKNLTPPPFVGTMQSMSHIFLASPEVDEENEI